MLAELRQREGRCSGLIRVLDGRSDLLDTGRILQQHAAGRPVRAVEGFAQDLDGREGEVLAGEPVEPFGPRVCDKGRAEDSTQRLLLGTGPRSASGTRSSRDISPIESLSGRGLGKACCARTGWISTAGGPDPDTV
jgi:hypothetical protein